MALKDAFLKGSYSPIVTPFLENGDVDYSGYEKLVEFQIREGSHGIVVNGASAEPSTLSIDERQRLLRVAVRATAGRVPVVAAAGAQSHAETAALADHALKIGADALMIGTPYCVRPPQRGIVAFFNDLGRRTRLPILIDHDPRRTSVTISVQMLEQIIEATPNLVGMNHVSLDLGLVIESLIRFGPAFRIFVGSEDLCLPMLSMGACGTINATSNIAPRLVAQLYDAVTQGNLTEARRLQFKLFDLSREMASDTNSIPLKYMARRIGLLSANHHRLPMYPATREIEKRLDRVLQTSGLLGTDAVLT